MSELILMHVQMCIVKYHRQAYLEIIGNNWYDFFSFNFLTEIIVHNVKSKSGIHVGIL